MQKWRLEGKRCVCLGSLDREADIRVPHFSGPFVPITLAQRADVKSVRIIHCFVLLLAASHIWGCASIGVGFQSDGTYVLERGEQSADCQALHKNIWGRIQILKGLPAKAAAEQQTAPPTASSLFGRLFGGPNKGLAAVQEYDRERAHVRALQRTMVDKKCIAVALDSELVEVDAEMARIRSK
mgnify:CR=1 FL=1